MLNDYNTSITQGGIGMGPLSFAMQNPRSVSSQMFNLSPSQRARGMAHEDDLTRSSQDRYLASMYGIKTRLGRQLGEANNNQAYGALNAANSNLNNFNSLANQFSQNYLSNQLRNYDNNMGLLSQIFGGLF